MAGESAADILNSDDAEIITHTDNSSGGGAGSATPAANTSPSTGAAASMADLYKAQFSDDNDEKPVGENANDPASAKPDTKSEQPDGKEKKTEKGKNTEAPAKPDPKVFLSEISKGRIGSEEELEEHLSRPDIAKQPLAKKLYEYLDMGGDLDTFVKFQKLDIDKMDTKTQLREAMKLEFPMLTDEQIQRQLDKKYPTDETKYTADEIEDGKIAEIMDSARAKERLLKEKDRLSIPEPERQRQAAAEQAATTKEKWTETLRTEVKGFKKVTVNFGDNVEPVSLEVSEAEQNALVAQAAELKDGGFWNNLAKDEEGNFSFNNLFQSLFFAKNYKQIGAMLAKTGSDHGLISFKDKHLHNKADFREGNFSASNHNSNESWEDAFIRSKMGRA